MNSFLCFGFAEKNFFPLDVYRMNIHQRTQACVWISFCEIYNEYVYDLLNVLSASKTQRRRVLRICEDQGGNSYIKGSNFVLRPQQFRGVSLMTRSVCHRSLFTDLKWINIQSIEEACKILRIGNKNRSFACTRMNEQSSRRFVSLFMSIRCFPVRRREEKVVEYSWNKQLFNSSSRPPLSILVLWWNSFWKKAGRVV